MLDVYDTAMVSPDSSVVIQVDAALMRLRRLWTAPSALGGVSADAAGTVELSTVLVVDTTIRPGQGDGVSIGQIAAALSVAPSTASRLVERAVRAGMVERKAAPGDPRRAEVRATPAGQRLHQAALQFRVEYLTRVLADWPTSDVDALAALLDRFATAVDRTAAHERPTRTPTVRRTR